MNGSMSKTQVSDLPQFLKKCQLFANLNSTNLNNVPQLLERINYTTGDIVIAEGGAGDSLYIVYAGQLDIVSHNTEGEKIHLSKATAGETIGEIALLTGGRRTASVYATETTELLRLIRVDFDKLKQQSSETAKQVSQNIIEKQYRVLLDMTLHISKLLQKLDESVIQDLLSLLEITLLPSTDILVREGEESDSLYIVINGRLRIAKYNEDGTETVLLELGRGETVGEAGLITGESRSATVYAVRDTVLARLSKDAFNQLLAKHPQAMMQQFAATVISRMQGQIKGTVRPNKQMTNLVFVPLSPDVPLNALVKRLTEQLGHRDTALYLNGDVLAKSLQQEVIAQTSIEDPANVNIVSWLAEQKNQYRYIISEVDNTFSPWTQRCLRQADHIVLVANANTTPVLTEFHVNQNPDAMHLNLRRIFSASHVEKPASFGINCDVI
jgi:CRP-like cAMP-binding protein